MVGRKAQAHALTPRSLRARLPGKPLPSCATAAHADVTVTKRTSGPYGRQRVPRVIWRDGQRIIASSSLGWTATPIEILGVHCIPIVLMGISEQVRLVFVKARLSEDRFKT